MNTLQAVPKDEGRPPAGTLAGHYDKRAPRQKPVAVKGGACSMRSDSRVCPLHSTMFIDIGGDA